MPRVLGAEEKTKRWNKEDHKKFQRLVRKGNIDIENINPAFINKIRDKHGWDNRTIHNFRANYKKSANTLRLAWDLNSARKYQVSIAECFLLLTYSTNKICLSLLASLLADSDLSDDDDTDNDKDTVNKDIDNKDEEEDSKDEEEEKEVDKIANDNNEDTIMPPKLKAKTPNKGPQEKEKPCRNGETHQLHKES